VTIQTIILAWKGLYEWGRGGRGGTASWGARGRKPYEEQRDGMGWEKVKKWE